MKAFLDLISAEEAYRRIQRFAPLATERIDSRTALDRVLAEEVRAAEDVPQFERANMDGYAVRAADTYAASETSSVLLEIIGQVDMGRAATVAVRPGSAVRVSTGAMMPGGADAVVMVEKTEIVSDGRLAVRDAAVPGLNTIRIAEDLHAGDLLFRCGHRVRGGDVGALTGAGVPSVTVYEVPRVGIVATGDEIVEADVPLALGQVRNVNEYVLTSLARRCGVAVTDYGVVGDDRSLLAATLTEAVAGNDAIFISGGSSKGHKDLTLSAIESLGEVEVLFHGVAIAPGKPTILARKGGRAIMGLPGNPAAATVVFTLFGTALVRVLGGERLDRILLLRPRVRALLAESLRSTAGRDEYVRVRLEAGAGGLPSAIPLRGKSVAISTIARADGLIAIPASTEGVDAGVEVDVLLL